MTSQSDPFELIRDERDHGGPGEVAGNVDALARLFPDAVVDGTVDLDVLADLLGQDAKRGGTQGFGLRWPGMDEARRLSAVPATQTLLPRPDESVDWDTTRNIVIEGDNLEVLRLLRRGYSGKVDVIYIDPPYNTGNDFVYDDSFSASRAETETVARQRDELGATEGGAASDLAVNRRLGAASHSKWLSMIYSRLLVAYHLLKETGIIVVSIDDTENARLKLVLDRVFGPENFVASIVWQGGRKNDSQLVSVGHDYMLIVAKNLQELRTRGIEWREKRPADDAIRVAAEAAWETSGGDQDEAKKLMKDWIKSLPEGDIAKENNRFYEFESDGRVFRKRDISWPGGGGPRYDVMHPVTNLPVRVPSRGWVYSKPERMQEDIDAGLIQWGTDHEDYINRKTYLDDEGEGSVPTSVFEKKRTSASKSLAQLLGPGVFDYPKSLDVLERWLALTTRSSSDALIVDFFAGSGSTAHAVMSMNSVDAGNRRYIMVQLDEAVTGHGYKTIADITRERLRRAGRQIVDQRPEDASQIDAGFRSYRLASSNVKVWDGTDELNLLDAADNLVVGRSTDDLLVEMMLRLGIDLVTPVETREVAGSTLYSLAGTLFAHFGVDLDAAAATQVAEAIIRWRDEDPVDSEVTVVVRDTGFRDSEAKLNLAAALRQASVTTLRSI